MIMFEGELSNECRKFLIKGQIKLQAITALIVFVLFSIPIILLGLWWDQMIYIGLVALSLFVVFSLLPPGKNAQKLFVPTCVSFDFEEGFVVQRCEKIERAYPIDTVESVVDYGEWYHLIFKSPNRIKYFVCQKNLITKGSLDEFEALFKDRIRYFKTA